MVRRNDPALTMHVKCGHRTHKVVLTNGGHISLLNHTARQIEDEKLIAAIGGETCACYKLRQFWKTKSGPASPDDLIRRPETSLLCVNTLRSRHDTSPNKEAMRMWRRYKAGNMHRMADPGRPSSKEWLFESLTRVMGSIGLSCTTNAYKFMWQVTHVNGLQLYARYDIMLQDGGEQLGLSVMYLSGNTSPYMWRAPKNIELMTLVDELGFRYFYTLAMHKKDARQKKLRDEADRAYRLVMASHNSKGLSILGMNTITLTDYNPDMEAAIVRMMVKYMARARKYLRRRHDGK